MNALFVWLWLATLNCFIVAIFKPTAFTRVTKRHDKRKHLLPFFIALGTVLFIGVGVTATPGTSQPAPNSTPQPQETTKTVTTTKPVAFQTQTVDDSTLAKGQTTVKQNGAIGVDTTTYSVTYTNGKETSRKQVSDSVTTQPIPKIIDNGTYVVPAAPTPTLTPAAPTCYPLTSGGNCYEPGEYCRTSDQGATGVAGDGKNIQCEDNNGWRWEPI